MRIINPDGYEVHNTFETPEERMSRLTVNVINGLLALFAVLYFGLPFLHHLFTH